MLQLQRAKAREELEKLEKKPDDAAKPDDKKPDEAKPDEAKPADKKP